MTESTAVVTAPTTEEPRFVRWVHIEDAQLPESGSEASVSIASRMYFDGEPINRTRGEGAPLRDGDPGWMRGRPQRVEFWDHWSVTGGRLEGTTLSFWVGSEDVKVIETDEGVDVLVCGHPVMTPEGVLPPFPAADPRVPVQVHMFVGRLTIGGALDGDAATATAP